MIDRRAIAIALTVGSAVLASQSVRADDSWPPVRGARGG